MRTEMAGGASASDYVLAVDVDGVLVHPSPNLGGAWDSRIQEDLGIDPKALGTKFFREHWQDVIVGRRDLRESLAAVLPALHPEVTVQDFLAYWFTNDGTVDQEVAAELLDWRKRRGGRTAAVTNQEQYRVAYLRESKGFDELFDHIAWSGDIGVTKNSLDFYKIVNSRLGVDPAQVWFFDDDPRNVEVALDAGWHAFHFVGVHRMQEVLATIPIV
ncbi:HAD family hydrolase [Dactylosporangium sp. CA-139114]|uniref:HAD family hydrolase n=1 Tax=Dactylosporangium sp. CA-139114 TaxID=3239931 RepID=UPI003D96FEBF